MHGRSACLRSGVLRRGIADASCSCVAGVSAELDRDANQPAHLGSRQRVSDGDLRARVETQDVSGELATLSNAFNRMTAELQSQQDELVEANRVAEYQRLFAEAVLTGVSAGVVGLDDMDAWI